MKRLEIILCVVIIAAFCIKLTFIPGGSILLFLGLGLLSIVYFPFGFIFLNGIPPKDVFRKSSYIEIKPIRIIGSVFFGIGLSSLCIGVFLKVQHWPWALMNLYIGLTIICISFIVVGVRFLNSKNSFYSKLFKRIVIIGGFGLFIFLLPELSIEKFKYRNYPQYIEALEDYVSNSSNLEFRSKLDLEYDRVHYSEKEFLMLHPNEEY